MGNLLEAKFLIAAVTAAITVKAKLYNKLFYFLYTALYIHKHLQATVQSVQTVAHTQCYQKESFTSRQYLRKDMQE